MRRAALSDKKQFWKIVFTIYKIIPYCRKAGPFMSMPIFISNAQKMSDFWLTIMFVYWIGPVEQYFYDLIIKGWNFQKYDV